MPVSDIALLAAANKGGVSSNRPVEPNCQIKIMNPIKEIKRRPLLLCLKVGANDFVKLFNYF